MLYLKAEYEAYEVRGFMLCTYILINTVSENLSYRGVTDSTSPDICSNRASQFNLGGDSEPIRSMATLIHHHHHHHHQLRCLDQWSSPPQRTACYNVLHRVSELAGSCEHG